MKTTLETAFETVQELVRTFEANKHAYLGPDYPEAQTRKDEILSDLQKEGLTNLKLHWIRQNT